MKNFTTFHGKRFLDSFVFLSALKTSFALAGATMPGGLLGVFKDIALLSFQGLFIGAPWALIMNKLAQNDPGIAGRKGFQRFVNTTSINLTLAVIWQIVSTMQVAGLNVGDYAAYGMFALGTLTLIFQTKSSEEIYSKMKDTITQWIRSPICSRLRTKVAIQP